MEKLPTDKKKHELQIWLYSKVLEWFKNRIIPLETEVFLEWGKIRANVKRTLPVIDSMIAASAITHRMFLVTRNISDFDDIEGLDLINPWEY
jgi:predicted nucleic acid-binding protein